MVVMVMNIMVIRTEKKARKTITHWSHNIDVDDEDPGGNSLYSCGITEKLSLTGQ